MLFISSISTCKTEIKTDVKTELKTDVKTDVKTNVTVVSLVFLNFQLFKKKTAQGRKLVLEKNYLLEINWLKHRTYM